MPLYKNNTRSTLLIDESDLKAVIQPNVALDVPERIGVKYGMTRIEVEPVSKPQLLIDSPGATLAEVKDEDTEKVLNEVKPRKRGRRKS